MVQFVPDLPVIAAFAIAAFVLAVTPGPDMALFLSRAINYGRAHGVACLLGAMTGLVFHSLLAALGISILIAAAPSAFMALKIAGAVYLLFLAIQALRAGDTLALAGAGRVRPSLAGSYLTGLGINLLNPKIILFFVTFLPQFVAPDDPAAAGKLLFLGAEFILVSLPPTIAMIFVAGWLARVLAQKQWVGRLLNWSFAGVFTAFAGTILFAEGRR
ncbi:LysE family translocator [Arsenicitalea aurantiaca]|uniref:LysE family translocator n=1 Tax=Arsenicitalea aurantiaca TaxID=1783274 RepID=A0A433X5P6_9HYPH|nr:LysE family translocator [Arsenicitalea aurantiaca]RUT29374.1 LysE family translocator [Arsenicitalea aurantiaca]